MVGSAVILLIVGLIQSVQFVVPAVNSSVVQSDSGLVGSDVFRWLEVVSPVVDLPVLLAVVTMLVSLLVFGLAFRLANYVFNHIPIIGAFG